jgi:hypothetical protein
MQIESIAFLSGNSFLPISFALLHFTPLVSFTAHPNRCADGLIIGSISLRECIVHPGSNRSSCFTMCFAFVQKDTLQMKCFSAMLLYAK